VLFGGVNRDNNTVRFYCKLNSRNATVKTLAQIHACRLVTGG